MKTIFKLSLALVFIFNFSSCEKIDEITDVNFDTTLTKSIAVSETPTKSNKGVMEFSEEVTLDLKDGSGEIEDYLQFIKEIDVKDFHYSFTNNIGDALITASLYVDDIKVIDNVSINLNDVAQNVEIFKVLAQDQLGVIASKLKTNNKITVKYEGQIVSEEPVSFSIAVSSLLGITANPI